MGLFDGIKPLSFSARPDPAAKRDAAFLTRTNRRRMACLREAKDALPLFPKDGETLHGIMDGRYDLMHLLLAMLDKLAVPCVQMRIATLSLSARNVSEMATLLDAGKMRSIDLLCSDFFRRHDREIFAELLLEFRTRGQRVAAARSHCKLVTMQMEDGRLYTLEGSANLRTNKNLEQFALTRGADLHGFYDAWISEMVTKHEVHASDSPATD